MSLKLRGLGGFFCLQLKQERGVNMYDNEAFVPKDING